MTKDCNRSHRGEKKMLAAGEECVNCAFFNANRLDCIPILHGIAVAVVVDNGDICCYGLLGSVAVRALDL